MAGALLAAAAVAAVGLVVTLGGRRAPRPVASPSADPAQTLVDFAAALRPDDRYRDPSPGEREIADGAVRDLLAVPANVDAATAALARLGFTRTRGTDPATRRPYVMFRSDQRGDRTWGVILVDLSRPVRAVVEVPHPNYDLHTERVGAAVYRRQPGTLLLMAGAHRHAADGRADVAHNPASLFDAFATVFAERGLPQLQVHGFSDASMPDTDAVISTGLPDGSALADRVADRLRDAHLWVCRAWRTPCGGLEGTTNAQAHTAEQHHSPFVHVELAWRVRSDQGAIDRVADALAGAELPG